MYKLIACDLDETLIKPDRTIDSRDIEAIKKLKDLGVKFVLATGRGYNTVQGTLKELDVFDEANQYVISYNGGAITENKDNRLLHFEGISFEKAEELYRRGLKYDVVIHVYTRDAVYAYNLTEDEKRYVQNRQEMIEVFDQNLDFLTLQFLLLFQLIVIQTKHSVQLNQRLIYQKHLLHQQVQRIFLLDQIQLSLLIYKVYF